MDRWRRASLARRDGVSDSARAAETSRDRSRWRGALVGLLAAAAVACVPATPPNHGPAAQPGPPGQPEKTSLKIGMSTPSISHVYAVLAAERTFREEGLNVELVVVGQASALAQAVASGSVDLSMVSLTSVLNLLQAGHSVKGFYVGPYQLDYAWYASSHVRKWADLKGGSLALSSAAGFGDTLTRHVLGQHGLKAEEDVHLVVAGNSAASLEALRAGKVDAVSLTGPNRWRAEADGFTLLGSQRSEIGAEWPGIVFAARTTFLEDHPQTLRAALRAIVKAIRLAKSDRESAVQILMDTVKLERQHAERAYDELVLNLNERGTLAPQAMAAFWQLSIDAGDVTEPWPEERYLDRRFIDSFDEWAPK